MPALVLPPRKLPADECERRRHRISQIIAGCAEPLSPEQFVHRAGEHGGHESAVRIDQLESPWATIP